MIFFVAEVLQAKSNASEVTPGGRGKGWGAAGRQQQPPAGLESAGEAADGEQLLNEQRHSNGQEEQRRGPVDSAAAACAAASSAVVPPDEQLGVRGRDRGRVRQLSHNNKTLGSTLTHIHTQENTNNI